MIWVLIVFALLQRERQLEARLDAAEFRQGETIRVLVTGMREDCDLVFDGVPYPLYPVDSSRVCLIGIPPDFHTGTYDVMLCEGAPWWTTTIRVEPAHYPQQQITFPAAKLPLLKADITEERRVIRRALKRESDKRLWHAAFIWPVQGEITSQFGARRNGGYHRGVDIAAERGTVVRAPAGADVSVVGNFPVHGKTVVLEHGQGISTVYCHLDTICVVEDQIVDQSVIIGRIGDTGLATAPHLHWGLYVHGVPVDPSDWTVREY